MVQGVIHIDQGFTVSKAGRYIRIRTNTRLFDMHAPTVRVANEWVESIEKFYNTTARVEKQPYDSSYAVRLNSDVSAFICTKDYYYELAVALLGAKYDIFLTCWKNSPTVFVTRPPLPAMRLDHILKFKADQGVKIYVLLNKEVW